ncbi:hypothetical protein [Paenibacillus silvae]|uniref:hypothetical protein n=1 Tax=Paenibacillus silvae TaxID=1325358 RepID=UPI002004235E|nr:hypothetical protein [Paenibacillus silvae]MCK6077907.1 hypothetical protein [Paenibacillus silvae]MCK6152106.1 hypothetical protein [Paenibacillus silvae]MCK6270791.1 hypothetical protein [Paenibacillus silvae]
MSEPKTTNLGLNKIDRSSPSTTYFDLDKYLDQNWEKIDGFTEQVEEKVEETATQVSGIQDRLDVAERASITLQPGVQVVSANQDAAFKLAGLQGRTVLNYQSQIGIYGVLNPYVIRYGENLLPPFYEWGNGALAGSTTVDAPYRLKMVKSSGVTGFNTLSVKVNVAPLTEYTLVLTVDMSDIGGTITAGVYWNMESYNEAGTLLEDYTQGPFVTTNGTKTMTRTFTTLTNASYVRVVVGMDNGTTGTAVFRDVQLNVGTEVLPFVQRIDSMLALKTELHANPDTGANPDIVFERYGRYYKLSKWRKVVLDGVKPWEYDTNFNGFKTVRVTNLASDRLSNGSPIVTKFNGQTLTVGGASTAADIISVSWWQTTIQTQSLIISVSNIDSGWGDSYTPTSDEIRAYFMGWVMSQQESWPTEPSRYDGTGTKGWFRRYTGAGLPVNTSQLGLIDGSSGTTSLPKTQAPNWTPYQLLYQLATPILEAITFEGQLTFVDGDNQVEVGTGVVLREHAPINNNLPTAVSIGDIGNPNKYKIKKILAVYKDSIRDLRWYTNTVNANGNEKARIDGVNYDPSAAYSVTYLMLDKYPAADITGACAQNEKSLLLDTVRTLQENTTRISVLESKKAEKDSPVWITPTLLNGWTNYNDSGSFYNVAYIKDALGYVHLRGLIRSGAVGTAVFVLPTGYRPKSAMIFASISTGSNIARIDVRASGIVFLDTGNSATFITLDNISFLAE